MSGLLEGSEGATQWKESCWWLPHTTSSNWRGVDSVWMSNLAQVEFEKVRGARILCILCVDLSYADVITAFGLPGALDFFVY